MASASCLTSRSCPTEEYRLTITFACDPARTQDLVKALFDGDRAVPDGGPQRRAGRGRAGGAARDLETDSRQNGYVLSQLTFAYRYDEPIPDPATLRGLYDQLTAPLLRDAARTYLDPESVREGAAVPEAK